MKKHKSPEAIKETERFKRLNPLAKHPSRRDRHRMAVAVWKFCYPFIWREKLRTAPQITMS